jgi:arylsulfatase A-like enzyme
VVHPAARHAKGVLAGSIHALRSLPLLAILAFVGCRAHAPRPERPQNLVLILVDTLRQDHLKAYGYARETAPTFTRLAREGALARGVSPTSWTKPAVASLLSGTHPLRHRAVGQHEVLPERVETLAERLKQHGYTTLGVSASGWICKQTGFGQGFDTLEWMGDHGQGQFCHADKLNDELLPRLASLRAPFFLYVHYLDPHAPYDADRAWDGSRLPASTAARVPLNALDLHGEIVYERPPELMADVLDLYDAGIRRADDGVSQLLARLEALGLMDATLTVVVSDHGEELQEHGRVGHGQTLYDEVIRVPLVFAGPGIPAGTRLGATSVMDVMPTALDLLGIPRAARDAFDGVSVANALRAGGQAAEADRDFLLHLDLPTTRAIGLLRGRYKAILARPYQKELFDLQQDPQERASLLAGSDPRPSVWGTLASRLADAYNAQAAHTPPDSGDARVDPDAVERLANLGYVQLFKSPNSTTGLPARLRNADAVAGGLLGWEDVSQFRACVDTTDAAGEQQLLDGWFDAQDGGRFTAAEATLMLRVPAGEARLKLRGSGRGRQGVGLRVLVDDRAVSDVVLPPADFEIESALGRVAAGPLLVRLRATPTFFLPRPATKPNAPVIPPDHRPRGVFLRRVCVVDKNDP